MRRVVAAGVLAVAVVAAGCGDDGGSGAAAGDVDRYCEAVRALDEIGSSQPEPTDLDAALAQEADLIARHGDLIDDLEAFAPAEIHDDVAALADALRSVPEVGSFDPLEAVGEQESRVHQFDAENCGIASAEDE